MSPEPYAHELSRWWRVGTMLAAGSQDWMGAFARLQRTGLSIADHQRLTISRYRAIRSLVPSWIPVMPVMPVIQEYTPEESRTCLQAYGDDLRPAMWVRSMIASANSMAWSFDARTRG